MSNIVERLRHCSENCGDEYLHELAGRAADTITKLKDEVETLTQALRDEQAGIVAQQRENDRLRAALTPFAEALKGNWSHQHDLTMVRAGLNSSDLRMNLTLGDFRRARTAITQENW